MDHAHQVLPRLADRADIARPSWRIAVVVDPSLPRGLLANTVAAIAVGIGAAEQSLGNAILTDGLGRSIHNSSNLPVPILEAPAEAIGALLMKALPGPDGARIVAFPQRARALHAFADYAALFPTLDLAGETIEGLGLAGPDKWVRSLTGSLKLLR